MAIAGRRNVVLLGAGVLALALLVAWLLASHDGPWEISRQMDRGGSEAAATPPETPPPAAVDTDPVPLAAIPSSPYSQAAETRGGTVRGTIVGSLGDAVAGAGVSIARAPDFVAVFARTQTDPRGRFEIDRIPIGETWLVRAQADGLTEGEKHVTLRAGRPTEHVRIQLWDATVVRGRVVDGLSGAPIAGAQVCASYDASRSFGLEAQAEVLSGADGSFELKGVPLGVITLRAVAAGYPMGTETVQPSAGDETEVRLWAGKGVKVSVTVAGLDAEGLAAARVRMIAYHKGAARSLPSRLLRGKLDDEGRWVAVGLPAHEYLVRVDVEGWSVEPRELRLRDPAAKGEATFRALRAGTVVLKGTLRDDFGAPLAGEQLLVRAPNGGHPSLARTEADGSFSISSPLAPNERCVIHLVDSEYVLDQPKDARDFQASDMRARTRHETVVDAGTPLELRAIRESRVRGQVLTEDGQPLPHAKVGLEEARPGRRPQWMTFAWTTADAGGHFVFDDRHGVENEMRVAVTDLAGTGISKPFRLPVGADVESVEIRIRRAAVVEGMVRGEDGRPVSGARVGIWPADETSKSHHEGNVHEVLSDRGGRYRLTGVGPGCFMLAAVYGEKRPQDTGESFEVAAGARVERDLTVE